MSPPLEVASTKAGSAVSTAGVFTAVKEDLVFWLNGDKMVVPNDKVNPRVSINEFIRTNTRYTGVKLSCGEGGCGACTVMVTRPKPDGLGGVVKNTINSCLCPLPAVNGCHITTAEGLTTREKGKAERSPHPVQQRFANFNASQCGYCTPGFVMAAYGALSEKKGDVSMKEMEQRLDGNICRCTGYRSILDACKSLCKDSDIEDLVCGSSCSKYEHQEPPTAVADEAALRAAKPSGNVVFRGGGGDGTTWYSVSTLEGLFSALHEAPGARVVSGHTASGVYHELSASEAKVLVDVSNVEALHGCTITNGSHIDARANSSISALVDIIREAAKSHPAATASLERLASAILRVGNYHVRNAGSIAGNLVMARTKGFLSDLATALVGMGATVTYADGSAEKRTSVLLEQFLDSGVDMPPSCVLLSVQVPIPHENVAFRYYKSAIRKINCHAYVNAAFLAKVNPSGGLVAGVKPRAAFGGVAHHATLAKGVVGAMEQWAALAEQKPQDAFDSALSALAGDIPNAGEFERELASHFLYKFIRFAAGGGKDDEFVRPVSKARQGFSVSSKDAPVHAAIPKLGIEMQAMGEAQYTNDTPLAKGTLFAAFVPSTVARGTVTSVDASGILESDPEVVDVVLPSDIIGKNNCSFNDDPEPILATDVMFHGQPVAIVLAKTPTAAKDAVSHVKVSYENGSPLLTIDDALKAGKTGMKSTYSRGDVDKAIEDAKAAGKTILEGTASYIGQQKHFYMETQSAYAVPTEGGRIRLYSSTQYPMGSQKAAAEAINVPTNKIEVITRRVGGGFGGKLTRALHAGAAMAVCATKAQVPVQLITDRHVDMAIVGGRHDVIAKYKVVLSEDGRIEALDVDAVSDAGYSKDLTGFANMIIAKALDQVYYFPHYRSTCTPVFTNSSSRTAVRGPGEIQASFLVENILDHVAAHLNKPSLEVREKNMYPADDKSKQVDVAGESLGHYSVPSIWEKVKQSGQYSQRLAQVEEFNKSSVHRKRGLGLTAVKYFTWHKKMQAQVNLGRDGTVIIHHGGIEMGQGIHTKAAQAACAELSKLLGKPFPMENLEFADSSTNVIPNMSMSGGSTTSEGAVDGVVRACAQLVERLRPVHELMLKKTAQEDKSALNQTVNAGGAASTGEITFAAVCQKAIMLDQPVNMASTVNTYREKSEVGTGYYNYGVALSEVEVDTLTGEVEIVRTDLIYDCGDSLNPAVDIGQTEGAFMMGVGFYLSEESLTDGNTGELISNGTWEYKPPSVLDVPTEFNVDFIKESPFDKGIMSSKATGEPPLVLASSVFCAVRQAIDASRQSRGMSRVMSLNAPITPKRVLEALDIRREHLTL